MNPVVRMQGSEAKDVGEVSRKSAKPDWFVVFGG
jgi:hypothetical protein